MRSPTHIVRDAGSTRRRVESLSRPATGAIRSSTAYAHSRSANGATSSSILPASIFEKSRMSLMIASSASPLVADRLA